MPMARTLLAWQDGASCFICHGLGNGTQRTSIPRPATVCMTSEERHKARYLRRTQKRLEKRKERFDMIGGLEGAFTYHDMFKDGKDCARECDGSIACRTLNCTYFRPPQRQGQRFWRDGGSRSHIPSLQFAKEARQGISKHRRYETAKCRKV